MHEPRSPSWARHQAEFSSAARLAVDSIRAHKLRSFLTLLGVIIGVASVILVGAAIEGLGLYAEESTAKVFGGDTFVVAQMANPGRLSRRELAERLRRNRRLTMDDLEHLRTVNEDTTFYSGFRSRTTLTKRDALLSEETSIQGANADLAEIRDIVLVEGRFFTGHEERTRIPVAVIGDELRLNLFPEDTSPLGKTFKIGGMDFTVIGVQEKTGSAFGQSRDNTAYIPLTVFNRLFGPATSISIFAKARPGSGVNFEESIDLTRAALRSRIHNPPGEEDRFDTLTPDAVRGFIDQILSLVAAVVVPVTSISLVVGGIVIRNIMLVSVTERTREIGIRKAVGARRSDIMTQVLIEAVILASVGGLIGVLSGAAATVALARAFDITMRVTVGYVTLAVAVSSIVGIVSGWYPALRAARLDPIEALRSE